MRNLSSFARFVAGIISFLYMLLALPHVGSIGTDPILNTHPIFILGWSITSIWILMIFININQQKLGNMIVDLLSFGSLILQISFFIGLFLYA